MDTIQTTPATSFPVASKSSERHTVSTFKMTWQAYRKEAKITKDTDMATVKRHQAEYNKQRDQAISENRAVSSALVSNSDFRRIARQTWTDKAGNRQVMIRLSDKSFMGAGKADSGKADAAVEAVKLERDNLRAALAALGASAAEIARLQAGAAEATPVVPATV